MRALVLGYGVSGQAAEKFLQDAGYDTAIYDDNGKKGDIGVAFDFCVVSPGISYGHDVIKTMVERDVPIIAEFELPFFLSKVKTKIVAVTGTNGKTTVVNQIYDALRRAGRRAVLCGNVGNPLSGNTAFLHGSTAVVEVSSFMLEPSRHRIKYAALFRPHIAVITNITQDHLERHGTMEEYRRCKEQIFATQARRGWLVLNYDDPQCRAIGTEVVEKREQTKRAAGVPRILWFSAASRVRGFYYESGVIYKNTGGKVRPVFTAAAAKEDTPHGILNLLATVCVGHLLRIKNRAVLPAVTRVSRRDRIELVGERNGVAFYNDSKATNIAATLAACACFQMPVTLILCGRPKGQNYVELFEKLPKNVINIVVFGECAEQVFACAKTANYANVTKVDDLQAAVTAATQKTAAPGTVLFSPSGSSFDMFESYIDRGQRFSALISG